MSLERSFQSAKTSQANNVVASGVLQRKCACGQHMPGGGECTECSMSWTKRGSIKSRVVWSNGWPGECSMSWTSDGTSVTPLGVFETRL